MARTIRALVDVTAIIGVLVFLTGGLFLRSDEAAIRVWVDLRAFGPWWCVLALAYWVGRDTAVTRLLRATERWVMGLEDIAWRRISVALLALLAIAHTLATIQRHLAFETGMDLTIYANACRNGLFSTTKGDVWLFADHFEPVLWLFGPLCKILDPAIVLLVAQGTALGLGAVGIAELARSSGASRLTAFALAFLFAQGAAVLQTVYYDFHLLALVIAVYPWLWFAIVRRRWALSLTLALLALGLKESVGPTLAGLGAYLVLQRDRRVAGVVAMVLGTVTFGVVLAVVYPHFRSGEGTAYFAKYYGHLGSDFGSFARTLLTRPFYVLSTLLTPKKLSYIVRILAMTGFVVLLRPRLLLPALPALLINLLSNDPNLFSFHYHYEAEIIPMLVCGIIADPPKWTYKAITPWRAFAFAQLLALGMSPTAALRTFAPTADDYALQKALHERVVKVSAREAVAATQRVAAHLTEIPRLYIIDYLGHERDYQRADVVVAAYPDHKLGFVDAAEFERTTVPLLDATLSKTYEDPWLRGFRIWRAQRAPTDASE